MLSKLHKMEYKGSLHECVKLNDAYSIVLFLDNLIHMIKMCYKNGLNTEAIDPLCNKLLSLSQEIQKNKRVNRSLLVACLKQHTEFFNTVEGCNVPLYVDEQLSDRWLLKCIPAFVAQFHNRI